MNLTILQTELVHATAGPWEATPQGMILQSSTHNIIATCKSEFDARAIVALRNGIDELIEDYEDEIDELKTARGDE